MYRLDTRDTTVFPDHYKSQILNSQIEVRIVTRTFPQDTFELTNTIQFLS